MTRSELKKQAKETLKGRWGKAVGMVIIYQIILYAIFSVAAFIPGVGSIAVVVVAVPLSFGFIGQMIKFSRNEDVGMFDYFTIGFSNFAKSWSIVGNTILKLLPLIIAYIVAIIAMLAISIGIGVSGGSAEIMLIFMLVMYIAILVIVTLLIIKSYLYELVEYIGNDNIEMSGKDIVEKSESLMVGHRLEYFVLQLSFIGWILLSILTFGIGLLWVEPYMNMTNIKFYENLARNKENSEDKVISEN